MATPVTIAAYITQAKAQGISYADLEASLKYMAIAAVTDDLGRVTATASDGTTISFSSMDALFTAIGNCRRFAIEDAGPVTLLPEHAPIGGSGYSSGWSA